VNVTAIIPLKALAAAKGRLSGALTPQERASFMAWMAGRVIVAAHNCGNVDRVVVVAGDDAAAEVARAAGAQVLVVREPGLDVALAAADHETRNAEATIVLAADLPEMTSADIDAVIAAAGDSAAVVVVAPTRDGGTGALLRRPPAVVSTAYGPASAARHTELARRRGVAVVHVAREGLANDVDTPSELPAALALAAACDVGCAPHS
jgi:2-phospho-L-lactate/phosphoenolpyruvate guanylyltransferase